MALKSESVRQAEQRPTAQELSEKRCEEMQRFAYEAYLLGWNECNANKHGMMTFSGFLQQIWHKVSGGAPSNETIIKAERVRLAEEADKMAPIGAYVEWKIFANWLREEARYGEASK